MKSLVQTIASEIEMSSLDVSEVTGKRHADVMRDIRKEIDDLGEEIGQRIFAPTERIDSYNRKQPIYTFGKDGAMQLALKYDAQTRYKVIQHINKLENQPRVLTEREQIIASMKLSIETSEEVNEIKEDVAMLKNTMRIDSREEGIIQRNANRVVVESLGGKKSNAYKCLNRKVFSRFWSEFKKFFEVARYGDIPKKSFEDAINWVNEWQPDTSTRFEIKATNAQTEMDDLS